MGVQERVAELQYSENREYDSSTIIIEDIFIHSKTMLRISIMDGEQSRTVSFRCRSVARSSMKNRLSENDVDYSKLSSNDKSKLDEVEKAINEQFKSGFVGNGRWKITRVGTGDELSLVVRFNTELLDDVHIADVVDENGDYVGEVLENELFDDSTSKEQISEAVSQLDFGGEQLYVNYPDLLSRQRRLP